MAVIVLATGYVSVEPDVLDWTDVLLDAQSLVEEYGWVKKESGDKTKGFSLHGAVGTAAATLTGESKDQPVARTLREEAISRLTAVMPKEYIGTSNADIKWNDKQRSKTSILSLIKKALATA